MNAGKSIRNMTKDEIKQLSTVEAVFERRKTGTNEVAVLVIMFHYYAKAEIRLTDDDVANLARSNHWDVPAPKKVNLTLRYQGFKGTQKKGDWKGDPYYRFEVILWTDGVTTFTQKGFLSPAKAHYLNGLAEGNVLANFVDETKVLETANA
jgi:hypothetical protein